MEFQTVWSKAALADFNSINNSLRPRNISGAESVEFSSFSKLFAALRVLFLMSEGAKAFQVLLVWRCHRDERDLRH